MAYSNNQVSKVAEALDKKFDQLDDKRKILRAKELKDLYQHIKDISPKDRAEFGREANKLKTELEKKVNQWESSKEEAKLTPIDITAPFDVNDKRKPALFRADNGSRHPLTSEIDKIVSIFTRMGFESLESRQLDNEYNMFTALNFPGDHPAKDDYDSFLTDEGLIPPAHTSTMQNRILSDNQPPISYVIPGRCYRNEDVDAHHDHTFHQLEGIYVDEGVKLTDLLGTLVVFLEEYFGQEIEFKTQPFYFPFVEPGLEFLIKKPKSIAKGKSDEWLEVLGCGMIHPNVLKEGGIDPGRYTGFAWGGGIERLVMLKNGIEDIRHFHSGKLEFLRQFGGIK